MDDGLGFLQVYKLGPINDSVQLAQIAKVWFTLNITAITRIVPQTVCC